MQVLVVPFGSEHVEATVRFLSDPEVRDNLALRAEPTIERTRVLVDESMLAERVSARAIMVDGAHVGNVVIDNIDRRINLARLHIYIGDAKYRGKGVGRVALALALAHAFTELSLEKIYLTVHAENLAAIATYQRVGFVAEGVLRKEFPFRGRILDAVYMGVLRAEYEKRARP